jgi:hypothetical protein
VASSSAPPPQPSLAQTIRAGVMSAVQGTAPAAPSANGAGVEQQAPAASSGSSSGGGSSPHRSQSSSGFRPVGVTQTVAFHAGRFAGSIMSGSGRSSESDKGNT